MATTGCVYRNEAEAPAPLPLWESALLSTGARSLVQIELEPKPLIPARPPAAGAVYVIDPVGAFAAGRRRTAIAPAGRGGAAVRSDRFRGAGDDFGSGSGGISGGRGAIPPENGGPSEGRLGSRQAHPRTEASGVNYATGFVGIDCS